MKLNSLLIPLFSLVFAASLPAANDKHDHDHKHGHDEKKIVTPNGGRLLAMIEPHAEFLVLPDRKVQITFLGDDGKAIAPAEQVVTVTAGDRSAPTKLAFAKAGNALVSDVALPEGNKFPAVVQIKTTPDAKTATDRFTVNLSQCQECSHAEYACTCEH